MTDMFSEEKRSWVMARIRGKDTKPEKVVRSLLHAEGYRFRLHRSDLPGKPDIVLPRYRIAVFVHGCFWHGHECQRGRLPKSNQGYWGQKLSRNKERDIVHQQKLRSLGWEPLIVWECDVKKQPGGVLAKICRTLERRKSR